MPKKICAFGSAFMKVPTLAIPGIKLGGIGNMRGYDKRAIGPVRSCPLPLDDGVEVWHGALGLRQLGIAVTHCKLEPMVANFVKVLCSQEIYRYALMEMGYGSPNLPIGMVTQLHLNKSGPKAEAVWTDISQRWLLLSLEGVRDITVASHLIGDMSGSTIDDPLSETYNKLGCLISPLEKDSDDYDMIVKYLERTYEPVKVGDMNTDRRGRAVTGNKQQAAIGGEQRAKVTETRPIKETDDAGGHKRPDDAGRHRRLDDEMATVWYQ
ncbi:hypothetical protein HN51_027547 [Arachis hypogaea]